MQSDTWLVIDANFLCHRASWSVGELTHGSLRTGIAFGVLSEVLSILDVWDAQHLVFCFDVGISIRKDTLPCYKANRHKAPAKATPEEIEEGRKAYHLFCKEVRMLRTKVLPSIQFPNILQAYGFEADDWIAASCQKIEKKWPEDRVVIVSADHDLFQCITGQVCVFDPIRRKTSTLQSFTTNFGIKPRQWPVIKAIAGCSGDNIPGVKGVGEKTAIKYVLGELKEGSKKHQDITSSEGQSIKARNLPLVKLPHDELPKFKLTKKQPAPSHWDETMKWLGMKTLASKNPFVGRKALGKKSK